MRIGLLEDDTDLIAIFSLWVETAGDEIEAYTTGKSFRENLTKNKFDVLALDWNLPDTNGLKELDWLRGTLKCETPVIFVTGRDDEQSIVEALEHGADDYMVKPVLREVALARIKALHRRNQRDNAAKSTDQTENKTEASIAAEEFEPYSINMARRKISVNGLDVRLTDKEFDVAALMFQNESRLVSHEELHKEVWGQRPNPNSSIVDDHISAIQSKLTIGDQTGWKMTTIYQCGYRLYRTRK